jgi:long-chain acyl-CoA synthetase
MTTLDEAIAQLTAPGAPFELETVEVRGVPTKAFAQRLSTLRELAEMASAGRADAELLVYGDERYTYREFFERANSVSHALADDHGVGAGDRVAILSANNPTWCFAFWGIVNAGAVAVALNGWGKPDEIRHGLDDSGARILIADHDRFARIRPELAAMDDLDAVFVIDPEEDDLAADPRVQDAAGLLSLPTSEFPETPIDEDDPAVILYTSGTTGAPKGAVATHRNWIASSHNVGAVAAVKGLADPEGRAPSTASDSRLLCVPLFHVSGSQSHLVAGLLAGWKLVLPPGRFDPVRVMALIEAEEVNAWAAVPTMVTRVCRHPERAAHDLSSVRNIGYGGAPAPADLAEAVAEAFPNVTYQANVYGLTETSGVSTINGGRSRLERPESVGQALLTVDIEIRDGDGRPLPPGQTGEVCVRGPHIVAGYWNRPEATSAAIVDGWLLTGDLGHVDTDGHLCITDRAKDMIIRGGENVYCVEIEDRLVTHPDVTEAAVFGVPHADLGEEVRAAVQLAPGAEATSAELQAWVAEVLADFKVPAAIVAGPAPLPRTETGKVRKSDLRESIGAVGTGDLEQA